MPTERPRSSPSLAYAHLLRGQKGAAVAAAEKALAEQPGGEDPIPGGTGVCRGGPTRQGPTADRRAGVGDSKPSLRPTRKSSKADVFLKNGDPRQAIKVLTEANGLLDTWIGHFDLGRAYLDAGLFAQADSEFDRCIKRRGEALSLFIDEEPTYGYLPPVYYYQGRAREGLKTEGFAESYREYLNIRGQSKEDPLLPDAAPPRRD